MPQQPEPSLPQPAESNQDSRAAAQRRLARWESAVERAIREAQERGDFDKLPGAGRPLAQEHWDRDWGLAHHVLKQAGETLPWIALGQEIDIARERLAGLLRRNVAWLDEHTHDPGWEQARERARAEYLGEAARLDKLLRQFSLSIPVRTLDKGRLPEQIAARQFDDACPPKRSRG